jgi:hypothetical protein
LKKFLLNLQKIKAVPQHTYEAQGERRYSSYSFMALALDGVSCQRHALTVFYLRGKDPPVPIVQEAGWAPEPVWIQSLEEKSFASAGDRT